MFIQGTYFSDVLKRQKSYVAVLPEKASNNAKVVILLHGFESDERAWSLNVPLVRYSEKYQTAFFCPAGENSFYTDHATGESYGEAFGEEFLTMMKKIYQLNFNRENVGIVGFSMGGYGAILLGLRYSEYYSRIGAFSPAFVFYKKERNEPHYQHVFSKGDYDSENDCLYQYKKIFLDKKNMPSIQFACGIEDPLFEQTQNIVNQIREINSSAKVDFFEQLGFHDFSLWEKDLVRFLETN